MVWTIFEYAATIVEYLIYAEFMVRFLKPKRFDSKILSYCLIILLNTGTTLILNHFTIYEGIFGSIRIVLNFIMSILLLNGSYFEKLFVSVTMEIAAVLSSFITLKVFGIMTNQTIEQLIEYRGLIRLQILFTAKVTLFLLMRIVLFIKGESTYTFSILESITISVIFFITILIGWAIYRIDLEHDAPSESKISVGIGLGLISINILVFVLIKRMSEKNAESKELLIDRMRMKQYQIQFEESEKKYTEIRKIRHDIINHLQCISLLINDHEYEKAQDYISDILDNRLDFGANYVNTGNKVIDVISNLKLKQCESENIQTEVSFGAIETSIKDTDMCSLLCNIFNNAIEACQKVEAERKIHFEIKQKKEYINIIMKNPIFTSILANNPELKTTKKQKDIHGYGVKSIRNIVKNYNGMMEFFEKDNYFVVDIWIPCNDFG